jgi:hypothetical protein
MCLRPRQSLSSAQTLPGHSETSGLLWTWAANLALVLSMLELARSSSGSCQTLCTLSSSQVLSLVLLSLSSFVLQAKWSAASKLLALEAKFGTSNNRSWRETLELFLPTGLRGALNISPAWFGQSSVSDFYFVYPVLF